MLRARFILGFILSLTLGHSATWAEEYAIDSDHILITVVLKHQQDKNLTELQEKMDSNRFWQSFPPEGVKIESWYVAMGLGQVITVSIPPSDLRKLNLAIEKAAWGIFNTEIYPTYEFKNIAAGIKQEKIKQEHAASSDGQ